MTKNKNLLLLIVCLAQFHLRLPADGVARLVHDLVRESWNVWSAAASLLRRGIGGTI